MNFRLLPLLLLAFASSAFAADDVSDLQVSKFKNDMDASCRDAGQKHGDNAQHVGVICGCLRQVLEENVTMENWRLATLENSRGHQDQVQKVLTAPNADKLRACAQK
ncbi:MAG TPA: hypothetical protein VGN52_25665 [Burkholderiales bacterium]|jgi:hypothetical protein